MKLQNKTTLIFSYLHHQILLAFYRTYFVINCCKLFGCGWQTANVLFDQRNDLFFFKTSNKYKLHTSCIAETFFINFSSTFQINLREVFRLWQCNWSQWIVIVQYTIERIYKRKLRLS